MLARDLFAEPKSDQDSATLPYQPTCEFCGDAGVLWHRDAREDLSAESVRKLLGSGSLTLCGCAEGQWWLSWLETMEDFYGHAVPEKGIPDNHVRSALRRPDTE